MYIYQPLSSCNYRYMSMVNSKLYIKECRVGRMCVGCLRKLCRFCYSKYATKACFEKQLGLAIPRTKSVTCLNRSTADAAFLT